MVGTSANISGTPPFTDPNECVNGLTGYNLLIDGGIITNQGESTIAEIEGDNIKIIRIGGISEEEIRKLD